MVHTSYEFGAMAVDPDGNKVALRFDWGDGDTSDWSPWVVNEEAVTMLHSWSLFETYMVRVQAKDEHEKTSEWSLPHQFKIPGPNEPPVPSIPHGPSYGNIYQSNQFSGSAIDPEGDSFSIRFDCGNAYITDWSSFMGNGDSVLMPVSWLEPDSYYVKAQAMDIQGNISDWSDSVLIMIGEIVWICATPHAAWSPRESHSSVVFNNKMWVIGGHLKTDEVWSSPDGVNWTCETELAGFGERDDHRSVVFDNKMWVIGGSHDRPHNDVWCSSNGINWTCVTDSAQWSPRWDHSSVIFNNKIWVLGGTDNHGGLYDVWYSADGVNWQRATNHAICVARPNHTSVVFDNKIWVMGGESGMEGTEEVWYSTNGSDWVQVTASAPWGKRHWHTSEVYDNKMWIIGGGDDAWYSSDGVSWFKDNPYSGYFPGRADHTSVIFDNKIWILGGGEGGGTNDVWYRDVIYKK